MNDIKFPSNRKQYQKKHEANFLKTCFPIVQKLPQQRL